MLSGAAVHPCAAQQPPVAAANPTLLEGLGPIELTTPPTTNTQFARPSFPLVALRQDRPTEPNPNAPDTANPNADSAGPDKVGEKQESEKQDTEKQGTEKQAGPNQTGANQAGAGEANAVKPVNQPEDIEAALLSSPALTLADVIASTIQSFPVIEQARLQANVAAGELTSARGFYDHKLQAYSLAEPTGFYESHRSGVGLARQLWWGGYLSAGYRSGRGKFAPWYKERETNKGGEFKVAYVQPLLQGRAIDPARVELLQANLRVQAVGPEIERTILYVARDSAVIYWQWVATGGYLNAQEELLKLAETRGEQLEKLVKAGKNKAVDIIYNDKLVAERRVKTIETRQKFREIAVKLSFFLRDGNGAPLYPLEEWVPQAFPQIEALEPGDYMADLAAATSRRPEMRLLNLDVQQKTWDLRLAQNQLAPQLDLISGASQDIGTPASSPDDKGQFELELGIEGEVPIQRRKARGKIQSTRGELAKLDQKIREQQDKIGIELKTARNALDQAFLEIGRAEEALKASIEVLRRFNIAFREGQTDLVYINLLESEVTESEIKLIESRLKWYVALAEMQAALALDPLDQAVGLFSRIPAMPPVQEQPQQAEQQPQAQPQEKMQQQPPQQPQVEAPPTR